MEGPRRPNPNEWDHVLDFFNKNLRPDNTWNIQQEYPLAINSKNINNIRVLEVNNQLISGAVMKMHIMKCAMGLFKVAAIGSVVTSPEHRNKGYSHQILNECLEAAAQQVCDFALLWSHLYEFYRKLGFELAGSEVAIVIEDEIPFESGSLKFLETKNIAPEALLKLYNYHTTGTIRTIEDIKAYLKIPNAKVYTAWDANNQILAYAVEGKGADLTGYIHEWGGLVSALTPLIAHIRKAQGRPITVIAPNNSKNFIRSLKPYAATVNHGYLGMIKILNYDNFFQKACRYAKNLGIEGFILHKDNDIFLIGYKDKIYQTTDEKDIVRIIFGPLVEEDYLGFDTETRSVLQQLFPIPFWAWGWDSV
ncbi:MAG: GNAT family N-acetyltransferase [Bdellovibrionales bacterium]|nr:GNAT family N-acetyltransferase [Bdellovibrionales bacterium]